MTQLNRKSNHAASRHLAYLLRSAGKQLNVASYASPDRYHRNQLHTLAMELREQGFVIENEMQRADGRVLSRYWLRHDPEQDGAQ